MRFIFYIFLCAILQISIISLKITVCPPEDDINERLLINIRQDILCNRISSINCSELQATFGQTYLSTVIIVHRGEVSRVSALTKLFALCSIRTIFVDVYDEQSLNLASLQQFCSSHKSSAVISVTALNFSTEKVSRLAEIDCVIEDIKNEKVLNLVTKCPRTVWSVGDSDCGNDRNSSVLNLHRYETVETKLDSLSTSLDNISLTIGTLEAPPWVIKTIDHDGTATYSGLVFEMVNKLAKAFNFRYIVVEPEDQKFGSTTANGSWNGLMGMLTRKDIDIAATELTVTYERSTAVRFSTTFYLEHYGILMQMPSQKGRVWRFDFLFSASVWLTMLIAGAIACSFIFVLHKFDNVEKLTGFNLLLKCFWYCFNSVVNQAAPILLKAWSSHAFLACWQLFVVSIVATYSGSLVSLLTSSRFTLPFKEFKGMMDSISKGETKVCAQESTAFYSTVMNSDSQSDFYQLKTFFINNPSYVTTQKACIEYLKKDPKVAYIDEVTTLNNIQYTYCASYQLILLGDRFFPGYFAFGFQHGSTISEIMSTGIAAIAESGLIGVWKVKYSTKPSFCEIMEPDTKPAATMLALNVTEVIGAFLVLAVGLAFAMIILVIEFRKSDKIKIKTKVVQMKQKLKTGDEKSASVNTMNSFVSQN